MLDRGTKGEGTGWETVFRGKREWTGEQQVQTSVPAASRVGDGVQGHKRVDWRAVGSTNRASNKQAGKGFR